MKEYHQWDYKDKLNRTCSLCKVTQSKVTRKEYGGRLTINTWSPTWVPKATRICKGGMVHENT